MKAVILASAIFANASLAQAQTSIEVGVRPLFLTDYLQEGELKNQLTACMGKDVKKTDFSIGHRGAALQFPEHTKESYTAAARQGAGIIECDVTFTSDLELVCRHAQNDLHTTTNILATDLATKCRKGFKAASDGKAARAECRTSDITLSEFKTLRGKMDAANAQATTVQEYLNGTPSFRTDLYALAEGTLMTHRESIELIQDLGGKFTPELKSPSVAMPFNGFTQEQYAQKMIDEYKEAGIAPENIFPQSFNLEDVLYWIENEPEFGKQAVFLDEGTGDADWDNMNPETWAHSMQDLADQGVQYLAPALWMLVTEENGKIVPSRYAEEAKAAGLHLIAWSLERSGNLDKGGGWYYQSIPQFTKKHGDATIFELVHVLAQNVGVVGVFSDWPATVSYYASCMGLE